MIYDKLENLTSYLDEDLRAPVAAFLAKVDTLPVGRYDVAGDAAYAMVHEYDTHSPETCNVEAHDAYIDIQATIEGAEGITIYDRRALAMCMPYNGEHDVVFFQPDAAVERAHTVNRAGYFTLLRPDEAHRPQEDVEGFGHVKKFVIKVKMREG